MVGDRPCDDSGSRPCPRLC